MAKSHNMSGNAHGTRKWPRQYIWNVLYNIHLKIMVLLAVCKWLPILFNRDLLVEHNKGSNLCKLGQEQ